MDGVYEWVRNIVIYLILNTIIMNLLGNSSYKKYVSIVTGMILLLIVVSPFLKLLNMNEILDYYLNANIYQVDASDFKNTIRLMEDKQREVMLVDFKDRVREQVADLLIEEGIYLYDIELALNLDEDSDGFGEIDSIHISAGYSDEEVVPVHSIKIDKIVVSKNNGNTEDLKKDKQNIPSPLEIQIKNRLSDFYNMKQDNINISIQGG